MEEWIVKATPRVKERKKSKEASLEEITSNEWKWQQGDEPTIQHQRSPKGTKEPAGCPKEGRS